jgi:hypothetical protein
LRLWEEAASARIKTEQAQTQTTTPNAPARQEEAPKPAERPLTPDEAEQVFANPFAVREFDPFEDAPLFPQSPTAAAGGDSSAESADMGTIGSPTGAGGVQGGNAGTPSHSATSGTGQPAPSGNDTQALDQALAARSATIAPAAEQAKPGSPTMTAQLLAQGPAGQPAESSLPPMPPPAFSFPNFATSAESPVDRVAVMQAIQSEGLRFETNAGQFGADSSFNFVAHQGGFAVAMGPTNAVMQLTPTAAPTSAPPTPATPCSR